MILIDANLLIYAGVSEMAEHAAASGWLREQVAAGHRIGIPWPSFLAFLRITTNPRLFARPGTVNEAWRFVEDWLRLPMVWIPGPTERHGQILGRLLRDARAQGNLVVDCHLAALAIEHGLQLCTTDGDFARFEGLRWVNPLRGR
ncbi:MAG: type II toxin-antitoxin system VapC family toxin [Bryobacterales bacterium]|nr:type II toxin-antitoxin system VapC family toxin [Bryobacterales bacterium]